MKKGLIYRRSWPTKTKARTAIFEYIETLYNRRRRHSTLGMLSPLEYENRTLVTGGTGLAASRLASATTVLGGLLRAQFDTRVVTIEEAEDFTLGRTKYLDSPHLRRWALRPLEDAGELDVVESSRRRKGDYPAGTKLRFKP